MREDEPWLKSVEPSVFFRSRSVRKRLRLHSFRPTHETQRRLDAIARRHKQQRKG
jgi:hypothetical protein